MDIYVCMYVFFYTCMYLFSFIGDIHQPLHVSRTTDKGGNTINVQYHLLDKKQYPLTVRHGQRNPVSSFDAISLQHHHHHHHSWNLHSIWDTALIETVLKREFNNQRTKMEASLEVLLQKHPEWVQHYASCGGGTDNKSHTIMGSSSGLNITCIIEWGQESWDYALKYAYTKNEPWNNAAIKRVEVADGDTIDEEYYQTRINIVNKRLIAGGVRLALTLEAIFGETGNNNNIMINQIKDLVGGGSLRSFLRSKVLIGR
jgi:hypothetical protein